ncbi:MAG TPA: hypothetical protein VKB20_11555, partial [Steroidobacteraceae bacterium]|nr:hypothetical protein [Steroidobacteraceae bacterium]
MADAEGCPGTLLAVAPVGAAPVSGAGAAAVPPVAAGAETAACGFCDGQGGSSARAAGMMPQNEAITIHNGLERSMKGSIIMVRRSHAGRKNPNSRMLDSDARLALIHDWLSR